MNSILDYLISTPGAYTASMEVTIPCYRHIYKYLEIYIAEILILLYLEKKGSCLLEILHYSKGLRYANSPMHR